MLFMFMHDYAASTDAENQQETSMSCASVQTVGDEVDMLKSELTAAQQCNDNLVQETDDLRAQLHQATAQHGIHCHTSGEII